MSNGISVIKEIHLKKNSSRHAFQSHSVSSETTRCVIDDFLLTFPSEHEPILYRLRDKRRFQSKIARGRLTVML